MLMTRKELRTLLSSNELEKLFSELTKLAEANNRDKVLLDLTVLKGRWEVLKANKRQTLASFEDLTVENNRIINALGQQIDLAFKKNKVTYQRPVYFWPVIIFLACIGLTVVGYIPVKFVKFKLEAEANFIQVTLAESWKIDFDFYLKSFRTYDLKKVILPSLSEVSSESGEMNLEIEGGRLQLAEMSLPQYTKINLLNNSQTWQLDVQDQPMEGLIQASDFQMTVSDDNENTLYTEKLVATSDAPPHNIEFQSQVGSSIYASLCDDCIFQIKRLEIVDIDFQWRSSPTDKLASSLQEGGKLQVAGNETILSEKDEVILNGLKRTYLWLDRSDDGFNIRLEGDAEFIKHGYKEAFVNQKPSLIQSLTSNKNAQTFYTILVWVFGIGLSIWSTLGRLNVNTIR